MYFCFFYIFWKNYIIQRELELRWPGCYLSTVFPSNMQGTQKHSRLWHSSQVHLISIIATTCAIHVQEAKAAPSRLEWRGNANFVRARAVAQLARPRGRPCGWQLLKRTSEWKTNTTMSLTDLTDMTAELTPLKTLARDPKLPLSFRTDMSLHGEDLRASRAGRHIL
jgi:hypothetical protein